MSNNPYEHLKGSMIEYTKYLSYLNKHIEKRSVCVCVCVCVCVYIYIWGFECSGEGINSYPVRQNVNKQKLLHNAL